MSLGIIALRACVCVYIREHKVNFIERILDDFLHLKRNPIQIPETPAV